MKHLLLTVTALVSLPGIAVAGEAALAPSEKMTDEIFWRVVRDSRYQGYGWYIVTYYGDWRTSTSHWIRSGPFANGEECEAKRPPGGSRTHYTCIRIGN